MTGQNHITASQTIPGHNRYLTLYFIFLHNINWTKKVEWQCGFPQQYKENAIIFNAGQAETYFILTIYTYRIAFCVCAVLQDISHP